MRPALKAGLRPLWRDRRTLQIGVDPRRAAALTGLGKAAAIVSLLDGSRDAAEVERTAAEYGIAPEAVNRVLGLLASAGVLDDFPAHLHQALPDYLRARLAPELACAALAYGHGDGGAAVIARRRAAFVRVYGADRIGACVATLLAASGVAWVTCRDSRIAGEADIAPAGLARRTWEPRGRPGSTARSTGSRGRRGQQTTPDGCLTSRCSPGTRTRWTSRSSARGRVPHLAVRAEEAIGVVGRLWNPAARRACDAPTWPGRRGIPRGR